MAKYKAPQTNDSPDLTPMIDVVFLLIVFFMVVAQQMSEQYVELAKMAIASNSQVKENPPSRTIIKYRRNSGRAENLLGRERN